MQPLQQACAAAALSSVRVASIYGDERWQSFHTLVAPAAIPYGRCVLLPDLQLEQLPAGIASFSSQGSSSDGVRASAG